MFCFDINPTSLTCERDDGTLIELLEISRPDLQCFVRCEFLYNKLFRLFCDSRYADSATLCCHNNLMSTSSENNVRYDSCIQSSLSASLTLQIEPNLNGEYRSLSVSLKYKRKTSCIHTI